MNKYIGLWPSVCVSLKLCTKKTTQGKPIIIEYLLLCFPDNIFFLCNLCKPNHKAFIIFHLDVAEIADEVYMEVIVGEEDAAVAAAAAAVHEQQMDDNEIKTFMPIAWAAAYGGSHASYVDSYFLSNQFIAGK